MLHLPWVLYGRHFTKSLPWNIEYENPRVGKFFAESMPEEYVQAILNADATGQKLREDYVSERINR